VSPAQAPAAEQWPVPIHDSRTLREWRLQVPAHSHRQRVAALTADSALERTAHARKPGTNCARDDPLVLFDTHQAPASILATLATALAQVSNSSVANAPFEASPADVHLQTHIQRWSMKRPLLRIVPRSSGDPLRWTQSKDAATALVLFACRRPMKCQVRTCRAGPRSCPGLLDYSHRVAPSTCAHRTHLVGPLRLAGGPGV